jgi:ABC-type antimicrobial peptide transport system permease subunit
MIVRQGMTLAMAGTAAGMVAGQYGSRLLRESVPVGASAWMSVGAVGLMVGASLIACAVPGIRALSVDPAVVLREEC